MELIVEKIEERTDDSPSGLQERQDRELRVHVEARTLEGMKKEAVVALEQPVGSVFRMRCDEGAHLAGEDTAPPPLSYFSAAIAFWLLTQFSRYGRIARIGVTSLRLEQTTRFFMKGSVRDQSLHGGAQGLETHIEIESDEPPERIQELLRMAEQTCFTLGAWTQAVPTSTTVDLNGAPLEIESRGATPGGAWGPQKLLVSSRVLEAG